MARANPATQPEAVRAVEKALRKQNLDAVKVSLGLTNPSEVEAEGATPAIGVVIRMTTEQAEAFADYLADSYRVPF